MNLKPLRAAILLNFIFAMQSTFAQSWVGIEPSWTLIKENNLDAQVITQRADSPLYSRMAVDEKFRNFAFHAFNVNGYPLHYQLILKSRGELFSDPKLRKLYQTKAGKFFVSYWAKEEVSEPERPYRINTVYLLAVVDTVPSDRNNATFKAVADQLPYSVSRILLTSNPYRGKWQNFVGAVKWNCKTTEGKSIPTMIQPIIITKPNLGEEIEMYGTGFFVRENGELDNNGAGKRNVCAVRSIGKKDETSKWARFFSSVNG